MKEYLERMQFARILAETAGREALNHFPRVPSVAAMEGERQMRELLAKEFPEDSIQGKEISPYTGRSEYLWALEPLDGKISFLLGAPTFAVTVGLLHRSQPVVGAANLPALQESYFASRGNGCWWTSAGRAEAVPLNVSKETNPSQALLCLPALGRFLVDESQQPQNLLHRTLTAFGRTQEWDGCYGQLLVASGKADAMLDFSASSLESAALHTIITEAGGQCFELVGQTGLECAGTVFTNANLGACVQGMLRGPVRSQ